MSVRLAMALLVLMLPLAARGQQSGTPEPIVRTTIDPPRVMVGQPATLRVEVLAPNYMTSPPELPSFQLRNAVTRQLQSVNTNEQENGIQYAGVRFEFAIYPLEAGTYAVPEQKLTIKYAAEPPATREAVISLPRIAFESFIPDAAASLHPFLAANNLSIEQAIQRSSAQLKAGDAVTRVITVKAEGTPAMLLPPTAFPAIDGLAVYPAQPSLQDKTDGRSDVMSASRVDSATYMLEKPGDYVLPAIDVRWWNPADGRIETAHLDAVALQVAGNPAAQGTAAATEDGVRQSLNSSFEFVADHWLLTLIAVAILALLGWFAPRLVRTIALRRHQRREAWLQSESYFFDRLRHAARRGDAQAAYFALLDWLQRFEPTAPLHTIEALKAAARDPALDHQISSIERELFAPHHNGAAWSPHQLLRRVGAARRGLRRKAVGGARASLPRQLNPSQCPPAEARGRRMPAR
jgi:hypothetical protein